jgi:hypothetical protein
MIGHTPPMSHSRSLLTVLLAPGERLSEAELRAVVLDGEAISLGGVFVPIDIPVTALTRAAALCSPMLYSRIIISDSSAAWVWGWGPQPSRVTTCVSIAARIPSPERRRWHAREVVIDDDEHVTLGGVPVTSPERTLLDLARHAPDDSVVPLLAAGITARGLGKSDLVRILDRRPSVSYVVPARRRLLEALRGHTE